ncbi:MAG: ACT domain-containing protein [Oscillospiraceae bacterium]|jgi:hypothetical protein|nr:ACT domain-containing protein [Oscillospiraceae bacterium]
MNNIYQLSVFVENKPGRVHHITEVLGKNNIDIRALSIAETADYGVLRLIVRNPEQASQILKSENITVLLTPVIAVAIQDTPGALVATMNALASEKIGIEYMYAFLNPTPDTAYMILRVEDNEKAISALTSAGVRLVAEKELYEI